MQCGSFTVVIIAEVKTGGTGATSRCCTWLLVTIVVLPTALLTAGIFHAYQTRGIESSADVLGMYRNTDVCAASMLFSVCAFC